MLCTTNIWIKIQKCVIPHKNLYFLPTFASKNSSQNTKNGPFGNVIRKDPGAARRRMRRAGDAAFHRETADPLALRETRRRPDADERHRRDAPRKTGPNVSAPHSPLPNGSPNRPTARKNTSTAHCRAHGSNRPTFPTATGPRCASRRRPDAAWDASSAQRDGRGCSTR